MEKRVSFDNNVTGEKALNVLRTQSLHENKTTARETKRFGARSLPEQDNASDELSTLAEIHPVKEETVELCDIEPLSGTVFRKVTVRRRRQENMRKMPAVDTGECYCLT